MEARLDLVRRWLLKPVEGKWDYPFGSYEHLGVTIASDTSLIIKAGKAPDSLDIFVYGIVVTFVTVFRGKKSPHGDVTEMNMSIRDITEDFIEENIGNAELMSMSLLKSTPEQLAPNIELVYYKYVCTLSSLAELSKQVYFTVVDTQYNGRSLDGAFWWHITPHQLRDIREKEPWFRLQLPPGVNQMLDSMALRDTVHDHMNNRETWNLIQRVPNTYYVLREWAYNSAMLYPIVAKYYIPELATLINDYVFY